jgi:hypothetical protein
VNGDDRTRALLHDTAVCYRFVKTTAAACKLSSGFPSYSSSTQSLLKNIKELSASTLEYLLAFPSKNPDDPADYRRRRQSLLTIRNAWQNIHSYVQPAVDADTLNVPTELIQLLTDRVRLLENCSSMEFAAIHTDKLNYFQFPPGEFERTVLDLASIVSAKTEWPLDLSIIALPHSQAQHLFLNGLLAHEIGHSIFSRLNCLMQIESPISEALGSVFRPPQDSGLEPALRGKLPGILQDWAEEIFCDLLGVHLLGPSFVLASIEYFDMANKLGSDGQIDQIAARSDFKFSSSHPSRLFRLSRQTELLLELGWWTEIETSKSHNIQLMKESLKLRRNSFSFDEITAPIGDRIVDAFYRCIESIEAEVKRVTAALRDESGHAKEIFEYSALKGHIDSYLSHAVVPSTLWVEEAFKTPPSIVLLNAAHMYYLSGIEDLIKSSDKPQADDIALRDVWMERVENWTTKGLEDISMLKKKGD